VHKRRSKKELSDQFEFIRQSDSNQFYTKPENDENEHPIFSNKNNKNNSDSFNFDRIRKPKKDSYLNRSHDFHYKNNSTLKLFGDNRTTIDAYTNFLSQKIQESNRISYADLKDCRHNKIANIDTVNSVHFIGNQQSMDQFKQNKIKVKQGSYDSREHTLKNLTNDS